VLLKEALLIAMVMVFVSNMGEKPFVNVIQALSMMVLINVLDVAILCLLIQIVKLVRLLLKNLKFNVGCCQVIYLLDFTKNIRLIEKVNLFKVMMELLIGLIAISFTMIKVF
jgi:hypothetical protein